ncbi:unnamed protein product [Closterium sp. NIES-64]|nr:unnamed protein product [Closterium sp. NIES-64]
MIPGNSALLNITGNFFYGDPMLFADGCQFCPSGPIQPLLLTPSDLVSPSRGRCGPEGVGGFEQMTHAAANKQGEATVRRNCFTVRQQMGCTANETQHSSDECLAICSLSQEVGPCDGHGACVPVQAGAAERVELEEAVAEEVGVAGGVGVAVEVVAGVEVLVEAVEAEVAAEAVAEGAGARVPVGAVAVETGVVVEAGVAVAAGVGVPPR